MSSSDFRKTEYRFDKILKLIDPLGLQGIKQRPEGQSRAVPRYKARLRYSAGRHEMARDSPAGLWYKVETFEIVSTNR
jgi:hypothetical protein